MRDLEEAAVQNQICLVATLIKHFRARLSPDEYREGLTSALYAAAKGMDRFEQGYWSRGWHGYVNLPYPIIEHQSEVIDMLLRAGATLRQDPDRVEGPGLLAKTVERSPSNAILLLRRQMAEGVTDHRDVRSAMLDALRWYNSDQSSYGGEKARDFFAILIPLECASGV
ncbi:hypothetical protein PG994_002994 [Apiospora phragmitis]|uniref:Uncharacterized protein n=1 Tax=Apiospora phragmitis TaxID=2905665 RepID=A0ABR1W6S1_9PEZI